MANKHIERCSTPLVITAAAAESRQSCLTLCDPMNHSTPGLPVHHQLPEFTQTHVHGVRDATPSIHHEVMGPDARILVF